MPCCLTQLRPPTAFEHFLTTHNTTSPSFQYKRTMEVFRRDWSPHLAGSLLLLLETQPARILWPFRRKLLLLTRHPFMDGAPRVPRERGPIFTAHYMPVRSIYILELSLVVFEVLQRVLDVDDGGHNSRTHSFSVWQYFLCSEASRSFLIMKGRACKISISFLNFLIA